jgi:succinate dehydrogenase / fumarate reductase, cytochrome b subunit
MRERPLSPHLSVYRFRYTLVTSIANRATGIVLSVALPLLIVWLMALANGPQAYERAAAWLSHPLAQLVYAGLIVAFTYHTLAGIRHLVWDTGRGMERETARRSAWVLGGATVVVAVLLLAATFLTGARA